MDSLDQLLHIITAGVAEIKSAYAAAGRSPPSLDDLYRGPGELELALAPASTLVVAASQQLIATLRLPPEALLDVSSGFIRSAAIGAVMKTNVPEIIREAGPQGLNVQDIGARARTSPGKIGRILRLLAGKHIFKEVSPGVFAHNRLSSVLDTGKPLEKILENPVAKHDGVMGLSPLMQNAAEFNLKAAAFLPDMMGDPEWSMLDDAKRAPLSRAFGMHGTLWDLLGAPGNEAKQAYFNAAMVGFERLWPPDLIIRGFPWQTLAAGSVVVDVGGGAGATSLAVARKFPELNIIVQDLPTVIAEGRKFWDREYPSAVASGKVQLKEHDFFDSQPVTDASVFILRHVLHDWPASDARKILKRLAEASTPSTRVLLVDQILPYSCAANTALSMNDIPGAEHPSFPTPLLMSAGKETGFDMDIIMMSLTMSQERTLGDFLKLFEGSGWKLSEIIPSAPGAPPHLVLALDDSGK